MDSSASQEKKAIPRFASFKPQPPPPDNDRPPELPSRERVKRVEPGDKSRHRPAHRSKHRSRDHHSRSRERRSDRKDSHRSRKETNRRDKELAPGTTHPTSNVLDESTRESLDYVVDRKGDKYNLIYGTIHRYSVPSYYRIGRGRVLGLSPKYRIDRETIGENEIVLRSEVQRTDSAKTKSKRLLSKANRNPPRLLRVRPTSFARDPINSSEDFVPLRVSVRGQRGEGPGASGSEDDRYGYRSIHGKLKPDEGIASDLELVSDTELSGEEGFRQDPDSEIKQLNVELSRDVDKNPTDANAWLRLINHQETVLRGSERQSNLTSAEQNGLADIKLSLYEKALKKIGKETGRDRLLIGRLEEGAKLWDTQKLLAQWHSTLKANPQYISLWMKYLDFRQTEFLNFTYERCQATFIECLTLNRTAVDSPEKVRVQTYLFLRLTVFLREAGYAEQATALWQGIFEFSFFRPPDLEIDADVDKALSAFADFWDSEVPRTGELGANGWRNGNATLLDSKVIELQCRLNPKSMLASWAACERERMLNAQLPARSLDEPEDDPYRVVLASDLNAFLPLVSLPSSTPELVDSFLYFCQLPPIITASNFRTTGRWMGDSFLRNELSAAPYESLTDWFPTPSHTEPNIFSPTSFPDQYFVHNFDTYFANPETGFYSFKAWLKATSGPTSGVVRNWVRRTLRQLVEAMPSNDDLAEYAIAVEYVCNAKEAKKYAKSLLKKRSSSLRLYNAYALMERRGGNVAAADHVWATAISMSKSFSNKERVDSVLLWHTWTWELLEARNLAQATHLLVSMPQSNIDLKTIQTASSHPEFSPTNLLKIRSYLSNALESAISNRKTNIIIACTDCQAIVLYLTHAQDIDKSLQAYTSTIHRLSTLPDSDTTEPFISYTTELLHQARARLLYHHLRTSTLYKPSQIRTILTESITSFPHNTITLSLFAWNESRFRIDDRVRDTMRAITTSSTSSQTDTNNTPIPITTHLFSIYTELTRPTYAGSTAHSARAAFEKALSNNNNNTTNPSQPPATNPSASHSSIALWKLYILFELSRSDITRAKSVFYRAMRACPWSKDILMLVFTHLRDDVVREKYSNQGQTGGVGQGMDFHELRHVYNVLVEKELRIHIDIERELDDLAVTMAEGSAAMGMGISLPDDAEGEEGGGSGDGVMAM
ncbi:NRDE-2, necessary for RNA interference-domain-containing protein [Aspergillus crustosus]